MRRCRRIVICIGSNTENAEKMVRQAIKWLGMVFSDIESSSVYPTSAEADAMPGQYYNAVVRAQSVLTRPEIRKLLKRYELDNGRTSESKSAGIIPIDLDLVFDGNAVLRPEEITCHYFARGYAELESGK